MSLYHSIKNKSEKRIWVEDFGLVNINTYLCKILCLDDDWHMETFKIQDCIKIGFVSGYDYSVCLSTRTIETLLELSKVYPGAVFHMEDTVDGLVAKWQDGKDK